MPSTVPSVRHVVPSCDVTGAPFVPAAAGSSTSSTSSKSCTLVPASAQRAVTSMTLLPAASRGASPAEGRIGSTWRTRKSFGPGMAGHADAGRCTVASWPGASSVVVDVGDADFSTGGRSACGVLSIVIATRKGVRLPLASTSSPSRTWRPSAKEPVANVSSLPETVGAGAAAPSSSAPGDGHRLARGELDLVGRGRDGTVGGVGRDQGRGRVVEADVGADGGRRRVAERVVADRPQVVEAVGQRARVDVGGEGRARVGGDLRPRAGAGRRDAERDSRGAAARGSR